MNEPTIFQFQPEDGLAVSRPIRTITVDGEPWFVARDVAEVLGYSDAEAMTRRLDTDEKQNRQIVGFGPRGISTINESGIYNAIMGSAKPEAKVFRKWVTGTVLPAIRKTGSYASGEEHLDPNAPDYLDRLKDLLIAAQERKLEAAQAQIATLQPKANAFQVIEEAAGSMLVRDAAKALKSTQKDLYGFLEATGWVTKKTHRNAQRKATAAATKQGHMTTKATVDDWGNARTTPMVTPKGLARLAQIKAQRHSVSRQGHPHD